MKAVDGVSFDVQRGEILGIVGESGCGKSTTARLLLRLIEPDAGEVYFEGRNILKVFTAGMKAYRRQVQMVFQDPYSSLNPRMNIEDAVAFNALVHGASRREARAKAWDMLKKVGLRAEQFGRRYPHELSGGQRQRVNIARALVLDPKLVCSMNPCHPSTNRCKPRCLTCCRSLKHDLGLTYVFISHDLHVIEYLSDRVLVMYLGQIVEIGSAEEVSADPAAPLYPGALRLRPDDEPRSNASSVHRSSATHRTRSTLPPDAAFAPVARMPWMSVPRLLHHCCPWAKRVDRWRAISLAMSSKRTSPHLNFPTIPRPYCPPTSPPRRAT